MTFSVAMKCATTGMFGAAITTSSLAVGSRCTFAAAGVGVILTQHRTNPELGPMGIRLLREGHGAAATLQRLVQSDPGSAWRQIAVLDHNGGNAAFHGSRHEPIFAEAAGDGIISVGNILADERVCRMAVEAAARHPNDHIGDRLIAALGAGLDAGGEVFALRSAALLVVDKQAFPLVDLRVDDDPAPIRVLERIWLAYKPQMDGIVLRAIAPDSCGPATNSHRVMASR
jgi:uncharacterized Ntn-hydrolase superfamily protein